MIRKNAFSLLEMMVVIAIIGFIAGMMVVKLSDSADYAAVEATRTTIKQIEDSVTMYKLRKKKFPDGTNGLEALVEANLIDSFKDAWKNDLQYAYPGTNNRPFDVWSLGRDGLDGGEGYDADIYNGEESED